MPTQQFRSRTDGSHYPIRKGAGLPRGKPTNTLGQYSSRESQKKRQSSLDKSVRKNGFVETTDSLVDYELKTKKSDPKASKTAKKDVGYLLGKYDDPSKHVSRQSMYQQEFYPELKQSYSTSPSYSYSGQSQFFSSADVQTILSHDKTRAEVQQDIRELAEKHPEKIPEIAEDLQQRKRAGQSVVSKSFSLPVSKYDSRYFEPPKFYTTTPRKVREKTGKRVVSLQIALEQHLPFNDRSRFFYHADGKIHRHITWKEAKKLYGKRYGF